MVDEPAASSWTGFTLELLVALLKHYAKSLAGDEAVQAILEKAAELGGGKAKDAVLKLLPDSGLARELFTAARKTDNYFQFAFTEDPHLAELARQLRDVLPAGEAALQTALQNLPEQINEDDLRAVVMGVFDPRHLPGVSAVDQEALTEGYLGVLRAALVGLPKYGNLITGWAVLRIERNVLELRQEVAKLIKAFQTAQIDEKAPVNLLKWMRDERLKIAGSVNDLSVDGDIYQSLILVGNNNQIRVVPDDPNGLVRQILERCQAEALLLHGLDDISSMSLYVNQISKFMQQIDFFKGRYTPLAVREKQLAKLDAWYNDQSVPYALLLGLPAVGKSTLLLSWMRSIQNEVIYIPLSLDLNIVSEEYFFKALGARLHVIYKDKPTALHSSAEDWKNYCVDCLNTPPPKKSLLIILDGLEQGKNIQFMYRGILPEEPPAGLKVLISACLSHDQQDQDQQTQEDLEWRDRLSLSDPRIVQSFHLGDLDRREVDTCLQNAGLMLSDEQIERFWQHSRGQPLVVQLLTQAMMSHSDFVLPPPEAHMEVPKLNDALEHLRNLNLDPNRLADSGELNDLVDLLACANGPLMARDLRILSKGSLKGFDHVERLIATSNRLMISAPEVAYKLAHPRLKEYLYQRLQRHDQDRYNEILGRFRELVQESIRQATDGKHNQVSRYALRYASTHVQDIVDLEGLASVAWLQAWWTNLPGEMFDYQKQMEIIARLPAAVGNTVLQARCALLRFVAGLFLTLPLVWDQQSDDPKVMLKRLGKIPNPQKRADRLLACLPDISEDSSYEDVLSLLAGLDPVGLTRLLPEAARYAPPYAYHRLLKLCKDLPYDNLRAFALQGISPFLASDYFDDLWQAARALPHPIMCLETQAALLAARPEEINHTKEMIDNLTAIPDLDRRLAALGRALARLPEPLAASIRQAVRPLLMGSAEEDHSEKESPAVKDNPQLRILAACPLLAEADEIPALQAAIQRIHDREWRDLALAGLAERQAQMGCQDVALASISQIESPARQQATLRKLRGQAALALDSTSDSGASIKAETRAASEMLALALIPWLPADVLDDALALARQQPRPQREDKLAAIAVSQAKLGRIPQAVETVRNIADPRRSGAWIEMILGLAAENQYNEAYDLLQYLPNDLQRDRVLWRLASALAERGQPDAADLALLVAEEIVDPGHKTGCLVSVAGSLPLSVHMEAVQAARRQIGTADLPAELTARYESLFDRSPIRSAATTPANIDLRAIMEQSFWTADPRQVLRMLRHMTPALITAAQSDRDGTLTLIQDLLENTARLPYAGFAAVLTACLPALMYLTSGESLAGSLFHAFQDTLPLAN